MVRWLKKMVSLPLQAMWLILAIVPMVSAPVWLIKWIWLLDRQSKHAILYLATAARQLGYDRIETLGRQLYTESSGRGLAAYMGMLAQQHGYLDLAAQWHATARAFTDEADRELLLQLEMNLSDHLGTLNKEEIAARIVARHDVSMTLTRSALSTQAMAALQRHQWHDAQVTLDRIFSIEDPPHLRWMRWVAAAGLGRQTEAERLYRQAWKGSTAEQTAIHQAYGWHILGDMERCRHALDEASAAHADPNVVNAIRRNLCLEQTPGYRTESQEPN